MNENFKIESYQLLLQKSGEYLENIGFDYDQYHQYQLKQQLLLTIAYCAKIEIFELRGFDNQDIYPALDLIKIIGQNLNYLSIESLNDISNISSIVLRNLGQILPLKLEYLNLYLAIKANDFKVFLKKSQDTYIKKLQIRQIGKQDDILPYIKKYIMKKERVKYLAFREGDFMEKRDLFFLKDEVNEFKLHNIIVKNYEDLYINCYKYIKEIY
ncbi:hypothetical protein C1645_782176 [Glomus cerebriforme]|uniref:Uncharacterized protein n=1 Tax=Glomus cerebriforme TaxID=658196 RepID=A0A397SRL1_9GLOM|nr:hypothetical protein C1645_782176 [Glomus cerebriforme]